MEKRILFFDVDGTLFDCANGMPYVSNYLKQALKQLQAHGHLCFVASGRSHAYLNQEIREIGFDGFVLCNGAIALKDGKTLISHYIPKAEVKKLVDDFEKRGISYCLLDTNSSYCPTKFKAMYEMFERFEVPLEYFVDDFDLNEVNTAKIEVLCEKEEDKDYIRSLRLEGYEILDHGNSGSFEINLGGVSKGKSIVELLHILNVPIENSIAFGDGANDMEMIKVVGYGVAMGNGYDALKKIANQITEPCVEHGIVKELQRLGLVKTII